MIHRADRKTVICHQTPNLRLTLTDKIKTCMFTKKKADDLLIFGMDRRILFFL